MESAPALLRFGGFELDRASGELRRQGRVVRLRAQPFAVLALLCERAGQTVPRADIQRLLWGEHTTVEFDQGINQCVRQIRAALDDRASAPRFVETLAGRGYRFLAEVRRAEAPAAPPAAPRSLAGRWPLALAAALLAVVSGRVVSWSSSPAAGRSAAALREPDPEALEAYRAASFLLARPGPRNAARAVPFLERALGIDPVLAPAHAALAEARLRSERSPASGARARLGALAAIALDPELSQPYTLLARVTLHGRWDVAAARRLVERALAVDPDDARALVTLAEVQAIEGDPGAARATIERAVALDPRSGEVRNDVGWYAYFGRRYDLAARECAAMVEMEPELFWARRCLILSRHLAGDAPGFAAAAAADLLRRRAPPDVLAGVLSFGPGAARAYFEWDAADATRRAAAFGDRAVSLMALGDATAALAALEEGFATGRSWLIPFVGLEPMFDGLRGEPRFQRLAARVQGRGPR